MKKQINQIKRMQRLAGLITENEYNESLMNEESAYINMDSEYPDQITLVSKEDGEYDGTTTDGVVTFATTLEQPDNIDDMSYEKIFNTYAPDIFKFISDNGGDWNAGSDYVAVEITLDKLKKLFPTK